MGLFSFLDKRASVRVVLRYSADELSAIAHEDYPTFIFIDCIEKNYHDRFAERKALFLASQDCYSFGLAISSDMKKFAAFIVAGELANCIGYQEPLKCTDTILQDALQSGIVRPDSTYPVLDLSEEFYSELRMKIGDEQLKLIDVATIAAACVRMGKASLAVSALLGDGLAYDDCVKTLQDYKGELKRALAWCAQNEKAIHKLAGVLIVHAQDYVAPYLTGSIAAHIVQEVEKNTLVLVLAYTSNHMVRVSLRMAGTRKDMSMAVLMGRTFESVEGEYGGDDIAAGGTFKRNQEEAFLGAARKVLEQAFVEERV